MMRLVSLKWAPRLCWARTTRAAGPWEDSRELELQDQHLEDKGLVGLCVPGRCSPGDVNAYCLQYLYKVLCD